FPTSTTRVLRFCRWRSGGVTSRFRGFTSSSPQSRESSMASLIAGPERSRPRPWFMAWSTPGGSSSSEGSGPSMIATRRKGRLLELVLVYAAIQVALWTDGTVKAIAIAAVWIGVFGSVLAERVPARKLGFSSDGLRASLWILPAALGLLGVI